MMIHPPVDHIDHAGLSDPYAGVKEAVEALPAEKILPIECEDLIERKNIYNALRCWNEDLILMQRAQWIFVRKGNWQS